MSVVERSAHDMVREAAEKLSPDSWELLSVDRIANQDGWRLTWNTHVKGMEFCVVDLQRREMTIDGMERAIQRAQSRVAQRAAGIPELGQRVGDAHVVFIDGSLNIVRLSDGTVMNWEELRAADRGVTT